MLSVRKPGHQFRHLKLTAIQYNLSSLYSSARRDWLHTRGELSPVEAFPPDTHASLQRIVVMKDQKNKKAHSSSAQLACESAGAIRTVAALTREDDCLRVYSQSLEEPLRNSNRTAIWSNLLYAFSQGISYFVMALVCWFGSILVSRGETSLFHFFVALIASFLAFYIAIILLIHCLEYRLQRNTGR